MKSRIQINRVKAAIFLVLLSVALIESMFSVQHVKADNSAMAAHQTEEVK